MGSYNIFRFVYLLFLVLIAEGQRNRKNVLKSNQFDVIIFTQRWPQTACLVWKEKSNTNTCLLPTDDDWAIHGIWPTQYHQLGPEYCNSSLPFNLSALIPIKDQLQQKWLNIENGKPEDSLWRHEWEKHGTCAIVLNSMNTEVKYFKTGLEFFDTYDMKHILGKALIMPGSSYNVQDILNKVDKVLGKRTQVTCATDSETGKSYLKEIRICFSKTLELIDCDGIYEFPTNCKESEEVIYPGIAYKYHVKQV